MKGRNDNAREAADDKIRRQEMNVPFMSLYILHQSQLD